MKYNTTKKATLSFSQSCDPDCPVRKTAEIIGGKWTTLIIRDLLSGKKRYSELLKSLDDISPKVLAARLKYLEEKNILTRKLYPTVPPRTEYQLTKLGLELKKVILAMATFGENL